MANEKRLIDANELKKRIIAFATACRATFLSLDGIIDRIDTNATVDAVEVVRCKDCEHAYINSFSAVQGDALCRHWTKLTVGRPAITQQSDFCSYGKRKTK